LELYVGDKTGRRLHDHRIGLGGCVAPVAFLKTTAVRPREACFNPSNVLIQYRGNREEQASFLFTDGIVELRFSQGSTEGRGEGMSKETWITLSVVEAVVTAGATAYLALRSRKHSREVRLFALGFVVLTLRSLFHLLTPPEGIYRLFHGFWVPVLDQALLTLFFILVAYALLYPLFPAYRQPVKWILVDNVGFLLLLSIIIGYDYSLHWQPKTKFLTHWGNVAFEVYQISLLLLILAVTVYVYGKGRSRSILLTAIAFGIWTISAGVRLWAGLEGSPFPSGWGYFIRGIDLLALLLLTGASTLPDSARQTFAQRYFADARTTVRELESRLAEVAAAKALLEERQRVARELHDSVSQALFGLELNLSAVEMLMEQNPEQARGLLEKARRTAHEALGDLRALIADLRPPALAGKSILEALQDFAKSLEGSGATVRVEGRIERPLPPDEESELYRIAYEAINNAVKHAHASLISVSLLVAAPSFSLTVQDDGDGFDVTRRKEGSWGLIGMKERAERLGASLKIESAPGQGTRITVRR
jgi:signal transduction histidine kinase